MTNDEIIVPNGSVVVQNHTENPAVIIGLDMGRSDSCAVRYRHNEIAPYNRHGIGYRDGRRSLAMGCVKDDDGDLDKALAFHYERCREVDVISQPYVWIR